MVQGAHTMWTVTLGLCLSFLLSLTSGSQILFSATPDVIQSNLTQSLTLRCSLNDTDVASPTVSGGGAVIGKRDVTHTSDNMQTTTSIVVTRNNGDHVATLIQGQPPRAITDLATMQVQGQIGATGNPGEQGYIELTWMNPATAQTGEYVCEINTISALGHNVIFSDNLEVQESVPTIGDLIAKIQTLDKATSSTNKLLQQLNEKKSQVQAMYSQVCQSNLQVQHGLEQCGDSNSWTKDSHGPNGNWPAKSTIKHVTFNPPYPQPPRVEVGVVALDHDNNDNIRYEALVENVDTEGFDVHCETWFDSRIYRMSVSWLSVSQ